MQPDGCAICFCILAEGEICKSAIYLRCDMRLRRVISYRLHIISHDAKRHISHCEAIYRTQYIALRSSISQKKDGRIPKFR